MLNRCISLLMIVGVIANPLALMPHTHAGMTSQDRQQHDAIPHIHYCGVPHVHHEEAHSHDGHQHEHSSEPVQSSDDQPQDHGLNGLNGAVHHPMAFNLPASVTAVPSSKPIGSQLLWLVEVACTPNWISIAEFECGDAWPARGKSSERIPDGSSLYLTLRTLRL